MEDKQGKISYYKLTLNVKKREYSNICTKNTRQNTIVYHKMNQRYHKAHGNTTQDPETTLGTIKQPLALKSTKHHAY